MSHYIAPAKPLCVPVGIVKPRKTGGSKQHIHQQRYGKICPSCKSGMSWQEIKSGKCWNCGSYIDATGKLRQ